jgi:hypothetical protein
MNNKVNRFWLQLVEDVSVIAKYDCRRVVTKEAEKTGGVAHRSSSKTN